jgi:hypothetical protein
MGLIGDIILGRATNIARKRKSKNLAREKVELLNKETEKYARLRILEVLRDYGRRLGEQYEKKECHLAEGDSAILNKYEIKYRVMSGWEISPLGFIRYIPEEIKEPLTFKIDKVYVDYSLYDERTERFIDSEDVRGHEIEISNLSDDGIINYYRKRKSILDENDYYSYGLYKTAMFTMVQESSFKPKWGLCVSNFLVEGTEEYNQTFHIWNDEIEFFQIRQEYERKKEISYKKIEDLQKSYQY